MNKKQFSLAVSAVLFLMLLFACTKTSAKAGTVTLVVTGNVHSQLDPCG